MGMVLGRPMKSRNKINASKGLSSAESAGKVTASSHDVSRKIDATRPSVVISNFVKAENDNVNKTEVPGPCDVAGMAADRTTSKPLVCDAAMVASYFTLEGADGTKNMAVPKIDENGKPTGTRKGSKQSPLAIAIIEGSHTTRPPSSVPETTETPLPSHLQPATPVAKGHSESTSASTSTPAATALATTSATPDVTATNPTASTTDSARNVTLAAADRAAVTKRTETMIAAERRTCHNMAAECAETPGCGAALHETSVEDQLDMEVAEITQSRGPVAGAPGDSSLTASREMCASKQSMTDLSKTCCCRVHRSTRRKDQGRVRQADVSVEDKAFAITEHQLLTVSGPEWREGANYPIETKDETDSSTSPHQTARAGSEPLQLVCLESEACAESYNHCSPHVCKADSTSALNQTRSLSPCPVYPNLSTSLHRFQLSARHSLSPADFTAAESLCHERRRGSGDTSSRQSSLSPLLVLPAASGRDRPPVDDPGKWSPGCYVSSSRRSSGMNSLCLSPTFTSPASPRLLHTPPIMLTSDVDHPDPNRELDDDDDRLDGNPNKESRNYSELGRRSALAVSETEDTSDLTEEISSQSLTHLKELWTPSPTSTSLAPLLRRGSSNCGGSGELAEPQQISGVVVPDLNQPRPQHQPGQEQQHQEATGDGCPGDGEEAVVQGYYRRDRRPSDVYFTPDCEGGFPWLTWDTRIYPGQPDLQPTPQQKLEAARDPSYILHLLLDIGDVIGQGQYGTVYQATLRGLRPPGSKATSTSASRSDPRGQDGGNAADAAAGESTASRTMALKKLAKAGRESTVHALAEQRALTAARPCPFIVTMYWCFQTKLAFYMLLELAEGGSLTEVLKRAGRLPEVNVRFYGAQLLIAVSFLHDNNILHRDLKLDNILLDAEGFMRLCDFGLSMDQFSDDQQVCSPCGTLLYLAPEVLRGEPYGKAADWWSYGVLLYQMASGSLPFLGRNIRSLYVAVTRKQPALPTFFTPRLSTLIKKLLVKDGRSRPGSSTDQRQALRDDAFFHGLDWAALDSLTLVPPPLPTRRLRLNVPSDSTLCLEADVLSASSPLRDLVPVLEPYVHYSKQARSRSLDPTGLFLPPAAFPTDVVTDS